MQSSKSVTMVHGIWWLSMTHLNYRCLGPLAHCLAAASAGLVMNVGPVIRPPAPPPNLMTSNISFATQIISTLRPFLARVTTHRDQQIHKMDRRRHPPVPTIREVVPGAGVNIVLKADQPTGRTVQGVIGDVLTRGNHPRGIKVRLTDGRVGRVQTMSSTAASTSGQPSGSSLLVGGAETATSHDGQQQDGHTPPTRPFRGRRRDGGGDIRYSEHQDAPPQQIGLDAYVKEKKPKKRGRGKGRSSNDATAAEDDLPADDSAGVSRAPPESATCPVCGEFEGDEVAVAHHVSSHFDEPAI